MRPTVPSTERPERPLSSVQNSWLSNSQCAQGCPFADVSIITRVLPRILDRSSRSMPSRVKTVSLKNPRSRPFCIAARTVIAASLLSRCADSGQTTESSVLVSNVTVNAFESYGSSAVKLDSLSKLHRPEKAWRNRVRGRANQYQIRAAAAAGNS